MKAYPLNDRLMLRSAVDDLLAREAHYIDTRQWDDWLALFENDAEYWIPSWDSEHEYTADPHNEVSLIYYPDRSGLEDRVFRIRTERSAASNPMPRTCHLVSNVLATEASDGTVDVVANWATYSFRFWAESYFYGRYEYLLARRDDSWRIRKKMVLVYNDTIPSSLDIYNV